jgi:hypothetical protein
VTRIASRSAAPFTRNDLTPLLEGFARWRRPAAVGATLLGAALWLGYIVALGDGEATDVRAYFLAIYRQPGSTDSFVYSPVFEQLTEPLRATGWDTFRTAWRIFEVACLVALAGPFSGPLILATPVAAEVNNADINLVMPAAIVAGFRFPALWAFMLLTKVTPGVGLVWFAIRREWRSLAIALGATAVIVAVSVVTVPHLWADWIHLLTTAEHDYADLVVVAGPIGLRVVIAAVIVAWGALTDRRWAVIVACWIALPATWFTTMAMLVGVIPLVSRWRWAGSTLR